jgi:signal transduction histidine kinase/FixJ family two-component response regulator
MPSNTVDPGLVVRRFAADAKARLAADAVIVWLPGPDGSELVLHAALGLSRPETALHLAHRPAARLGEWLTSRRPPAFVDVGHAATTGHSWLSDESARSLLVVRLSADGASPGLLVALRRRRRFGATHLARARALAGAAASELQTAQRFAEQRARAERAEMLLAVTQTLASTSDLTAALDDVARRTAQALNAERCDIELTVQRPHAGASADATALVVPITRKHEIIGTLRLAGAARDEWPHAAVELATAIAAQIGLAADNARLYRQAQEHAVELTALRDVATTLTSTLDLPSVLEAIADSAMALIGAQHCALFELDASNTLVPKVSRGLPFDVVVTLKPGQGAVGAAALRRAPFFTPDVRTHEPPGYGAAVTGAGKPLRELAGGEWFRAVLAVPLVTKDTVLGVIALYWEEPHAYDEREVRLLTGLAQHAAVVLDRARVHGAALRRAEELGALLRAARTVMAGLDPKVTLEQIVHEAAGIAGTPHVTLLLLDREARALRVGAISGSPVPPDFVMPLGVGHSGTVAITGEPLFVADTPSDPGNTLAQRDRDAGIVTYLGLPIRIRERILGVLTVNTTAPRRYTPVELEYLASFADLAAIALDNTRLYDDAQRALGDLKAVQQKLVQGETLRALGELAGGAAHHLNNLLTIVVGRAQLLLRTVEDERVRRPLGIIERAAKDGAEVVRRVQQFSRTRRVSQPRALALEDVARDALGLTRGHWQDGARAKGVTIDVDEALASAPTEGDPAALREAVTGLVLNAVDAMPKGGRLTVTTRLEGDRVALAVADTGVGMTDSVRLHAHEPFFTTKGVRATGLGLSVAYGIVRSHGGELTIESAEGAGTTVTLRLPRATAPRAAPPPPARQRAGGALRVLLVDDEDDVRDALAEMLQNHGHTVMTARGADEARELLEREPDLDLVLTDLVMPGGTGWDVAAAAKARRPHVRVGLVTGWGDTTAADDARRSAVDFVVEKPVTLEALHDAIDRPHPR